MEMVSFEAPSLIKERSSRPPDPHLPITQHSYLSGLHLRPSLLPILCMVQGPRLVLEVCFLTTHIGFRCIRCVVIVLHLVSWSDDPLLLLSSFNPYLSDPLTLLSLIHDSHNVVLPLFSLSHNIIVVLLIIGELSHYLVTVTRRTSLL